MKLSVMTVCRWISAQYKSSYISMCVLWLLLIATAVAQDVASCNLTSYFSCHGDCCVRGEMLCHEKEQRCVLCENKKDLCGTDREPRDCYLYCYKLKHENTTIKEEDGMYFTTATLVAGVVGIVLLSFGAGALSAVCCYSKYKKKQRLGSSVTVHDQDGQEQELDVLVTGGQGADAKPLLCKGQPASKQPSRSTLTSEATGSNDTIGSTEQKSMQLTKREGTENDHNVNNDNRSPSMTSSRSSSPTTTTTPSRAVPPEADRQAAAHARAHEQPIQDPGNGVFPVGGVGLEVNSVHDTPSIQGYAVGEGYTAGATAQGHKPICLSSIPASADVDPDGIRSIHTGTESGVFRRTVAAI